MKSLSLHRALKVALGMGMDLKSQPTEILLARLNPGFKRKVVCFIRETMPQPLYGNGKKTFQ